jgi:proteasome assembly chaperone (PAC2) family protein
MMISASSLGWVSLGIGTLGQMIISHQHHSFVMRKIVSGFCEHLNRQSPGGGGGIISIFEKLKFYIWKFRCPY